MGVASLIIRYVTLLVLRVEDPWIDNHGAGIDTFVSVAHGEEFALGRVWYRAFVPRLTRARCEGAGMPLPMWLSYWDAHGEGGELAPLADMAGALAQ